jgi:hypothetical protein
MGDNNGNWSKQLRKTEGNDPNGPGMNSSSARVSMMGSRMTQFGFPSRWAIAQVCVGMLRSKRRGQTEFTGIRNGKQTPAWFDSRITDSRGA